MYLGYLIREVEVTMKQLIINADDFGLHPAVNQGIIKGYQDGIITSTSIMPGAAAFQEAVNLAKENPGLGIGVHLTLVAERPVCNPSQIPSLVDEHGFLPKQYPAFLIRFLQGAISRKEITCELRAQIEAVRQAGLTITHLDSHQHLHVFPGILSIVLSLAREFSIPAMRIPAEAYTYTGTYPWTLPRLLSRGILTFLANRARTQARRQGLVVPDSFFGMLAGGHMTEPYLQQILQDIPAGCSEIMMHPAIQSAAMHQSYGWQYDWEGELAAALSPTAKATIKNNNLSLVSFAALAN